MLAYPHKSLDNLEIIAEAKQAQRDHLLTNEELTRIQTAHAVNLYQPNIFIRIGLFTAVVVIVCMGLGFFALLIGSETGLGGLSIFVSLIVYGSLELLIRNARHYRSGIDDALLWLSMGLFLTGINIMAHVVSNQVQSIMIFILSLYSTLRFANSIMSAVMFASFLAIVFYTLIPVSPFFKIIMPLITALLSLGIYILVKKNQGKQLTRHYRYCLLMLEVLGLAGIYASVNYFVVRETANQLLGLRLTDTAPLAGGWFFWIATIVVPVIYLIRGLYSKDIVMLRIGLIAIIATILTIHRYYAIAPPETVMTIGGIALIIACYFIFRYFRNPRHRITVHENNDPALPGYLQLESIILSETFQQDLNHPKSHTQFGGGSSGGGGATGEF